MDVDRETTNTGSGSNPPVCRRCALRGTACCTSPQGVALAPLLPVEVERIARLTQKPASEFTSRRPLDGVERRALWSEDPALKGLGADGWLVSLRVVDGRCVFLTEEGCGLGAERPLLCKRYPFVRLGRGSWRVRPGGECLALEEAEDMEALLGLLQTEIRTLEQIDRLLRRALEPPLPDR